MATQNLKDTLNDYLDALEQEEKETEFELENLDLTEIIKHVKKSIDSLIKGSQTTFEVDFEAFDKIYFSRIYMESIFLNLITNSIKYSKPGVLPVVSIRAQIEDGKRKLIFSDNGKGFDVKSVKDKVFGLRQKFTDLKDSKGIGLYLVSNNIQSMGGQIDVESEIDKGTTFTITFKDH